MDMVHRPVAVQRPVAGPSPSPIRPAAIFEALWRRKGMIVRSAVLAGLLGALASMIMPRTYTSTAQLLVDPRGLKVVEKDIAPQAREPDLSVSIIESEMRIIGSELVLQRVIDRVGLADPAPGSATAAARGGLLTPVLTVLADGVATLRQALGRPSPPAASPRQSAMQSLQRSIRISRQPNTYVVDVSVTMKDREQAAQVANAIASEYIGARFDGRAEASKRAAHSIDVRLDELRRQLRDSDAAVERYKEQNGLASSSGRLLTESRLGELSTQLQAARAETVRARTRIDELRAARAGRSGTSLEGMQSPTLERLRSSQALARQREASLSATLLPSHPLVRQARQEAQSVDRSVEQELSRILETASTALDRARATEQALERQLAEMTKVSVRDGAALVELRELERIAEANRSVYQTFLLRTRELVEQQRIDPNLAMILASAEPGRAPNGPGMMPFAIAAMMAGGGLASGLALWRDRRDPRLRSLSQLEELSGSASTHRVPVAPPRGSRFRLRSASREGAQYFVAAAGSATDVELARIYRTVATARGRQGPALLVVVAAEPFQGKSTVALNLAVAGARAGDNVILVDADRDTATATRSAGVAELPGLAEVLSGATPCTGAIVKRTDPPVDLLPAGNLSERRLGRTVVDRLGETLLDGLAAYDAIVVDGGIAGRDRLTLALAARADACLLVVLEGGADKAAVEEATQWLEGATHGAAHVVMIGRR
ncbi:MAG: GumC family protein [Hyphomicrobiaceae bacterium]